MAERWETAAIVRVDLHAHTRRSTDAWTTPAGFVRRAAAAGLDWIAETDHGRLDGALALPQEGPPSCSNNASTK